MAHVLRKTVSVRGQMSPEESNAREDLVAIFRQAALNGWANLAMAHASARVPRGHVQICVRIDGSRRAHG